jgi:hypothetical protein
MKDLYNENNKTLKEAVVENRKTSRVHGLEKSIL